jgi:hypothetical protein
MLVPRQFSTIAVTAKELHGNNDLIDRAKKASMDSFGREHNIFTNFVQRYMCLSSTAILAWHGQRRNAHLIALTTKRNIILSGWFAGILAFTEVKK